jgi:hypothetical protein
MPAPKDQNELDAYYLADPAHPRAAGVMWAAIVERRIDKLFAIGFGPTKLSTMNYFDRLGHWVIMR